MTGGCARAARGGEGLGRSSAAGSGRAALASRRGLGPPPRCDRALRPRPVTREAALGLAREGHVTGMGPRFWPRGGGGAAPCSGPAGLWASGQGEVLLPRGERRGPGTAPSPGEPAGAPRPSSPLPPRPPPLCPRMPPPCPSRPFPAPGVPPAISSPPAQLSAPLPDLLLTSIHASADALFWNPTRTRAPGPGAPHPAVLLPALQPPPSSRTPTVLMLVLTLELLQKCCHDQDKIMNFG